jgi:hypothetical protein
MQTIPKAGDKSQFIDYANQLARILLNSLWVGAATHPFCTRLQTASRNFVACSKY